MSEAQQTATASPVAAPPSAGAPATSSGSTFEARMEAIQAEIKAEGPNPAMEAEASDDAGPANDVAAEPADADTQRAERKARLEKLQAEERGRVDAKSRLAAGDVAKRERDEAIKRADAAEALAKARIDPSSLDEAGFFRLAQQLKIPPQKLGEFIRDSTLNPETIAARAAQAAVDPKIAAIEERQAKLDADVKAWREQQEGAAENAKVDAAKSEWFGYVKTNATAAPLSAKLLEQHGGDEFWAIANAAGASLSPGAGQQALLDAVEHYLDTEGRQRAVKLAELYGLTAGGAPSKETQHSPSKSAAAKATTVSNTNAQERASVVSDDDWAKLPFKERLARLSK